MKIPKNGPVVVKIGADWCGPCKQIAPILEELAKENEDVEFRFVNSRREFDPYRKEERYKDFLKRNYLPITHWNE